MKKTIFVIIAIMLIYNNMNARITLGNVQLNNVSQFEINESILEISNTAKVIIPRNYAKIADKPILDYFKVGDKVIIESGYDESFNTEFVGYIAEIDADIPLVISCDDEFYPLKQTNFVLSYKNASLKQVVTDVVGRSLNLTCPDVNIGRYIVDNASGFAVIQDLCKTFGLYAKLFNGKLDITLAYGYGDNINNHSYVISSSLHPSNVKANDLKYKRLQDYKIRYNAIALNPDGSKTKVTVGSNSPDASERTLNFAGPLSEAQLKEQALAVMAKANYDGYSGTITGYGEPIVRAGDSIEILDKDNPERSGKYIVEKSDILFNESAGFSRINALGFKIK